MINDRNLCKFLVYMNALPTAQPLTIKSDCKFDNRCLILNLHTIKYTVKL